jgi:lincosamide nucleotidyltransferase B/F
VGLLRFYRGEKLMAARFVQNYAVDRVVDLVAQTMEEHPAFRDSFNPERRFEKRYPSVAPSLSDFIQGYERTPESALAVLTFLETHFRVDESMSNAMQFVM